jgi:hypothetical protein
MATAFSLSVPQVTEKSNPPQPQARDARLKKKAECDTHDSKRGSAREKWER